MVSPTARKLEIEIAVEGQLAVKGEEVESVGLFRCELATGPGGACEDSATVRVVDIEDLEAEAGLVDGGESVAGGFYDVEVRDLSGNDRLVVGACDGDGERALCGG